MYRYDHNKFHKLCTACLCIVVTLLFVSCKHSSQDNSASDATFRTALSLYEQGRKFQKSGNFKKSIELFDSCIRISSPIPEVNDSLVRPVSESLLRLFNSYQNLGETEEAVNHLKEIYSKAPLLHDRCLRDYDSILGYALSRTERMDEAEVVTRQALSKPLYQPTHQRLFRDYAFAAAVFYSNNDMQEQVIKWSEQAIDEAQQTKNFSGAQYVRTLLGLVYKRLGKLNEASQMLHESLNEAKERNDTLGTIHALNSLADLYLYWQVAAYADSYVNRSLDLAKSLADDKTGIVAQTNIIKAQTVQKVGHPDSATYFFDEAEKISKDLSYNSGLVDVDLQRGIYLLSCHDDKSHKEGLEDLMRVTKQATPFNRAKAMMQLGYAYIDNGDNARGEQMLDSMYAIVNNTKTPIYIGINYEKLIKYYANKGDLKHVRQYANMQSDEQDVNNSRRLNMTLAQSIVDLKVQQSKQEMQSEREQFIARVIAGSVFIVFIIVASIIIVSLRMRWYSTRNRLQEMRLNELAQTIRNLQLSNLGKKTVDKSNHNEAIETTKNEDDNATNEEYAPAEATPMQINIPKLTLKEDDDAFQKEFAKIYPNFVNNLRQHIPNLGRREELLCMLILLNQRTNQISDLMGISESSVRMLRHRVRQKFGLDQKDSLEEEIRKFVHYL